MSRWRRTCAVSSLSWSPTGVRRCFVEALRSFLSEYYKHEGIRCGVLTVARADESLPVLEARLRTLVQNEFGCTLELETREDPSIVGGFVFSLEDYLLDASVRRKLDVIRKRYVENNRRLI